MAGSAHHITTDFSDRGRPFWLPPGGWDNGLADESWAAIVDVTSEVAADLILLEFRDAGVPGYAARLAPPHRAKVPRGGHGTVRVRIWVGCSAYGRAETTLMRILPTLAHSLGGQVIG